jgi:acyl-CoA reductase-like NAD-dependent aldehyde dehydrogenase
VKSFVFGRRGMAKIQIQNYINGKFQQSGKREADKSAADKSLKSQGDALNDAQTISSANPATLELIAEMPNSSKADIDLAVGAAKSAFLTWSSTDTQLKSTILFKIASLIEQRIDEFAMAESIDQGFTLF